MKKWGWILSIIVALGLGFWLSRQLKFPSKKVVDQQHDVILEQIKEVSKLVTVEGQFAEIYDYKDYYTYDWAPLRKKALIRIQATVQVGYDLSSIEVFTYPDQQRIEIANLPKPEILSIDHELDYYDLNQGAFNRFSSADLTDLQDKAKTFIRSKAEESVLLDRAEKQGLAILQNLLFLSGTTDWEIVIKGKESPEALKMSNSAALSYPRFAHKLDSVSNDSLRSIVMGHFDPSTSPDFVRIDTIYADRPGLYLHRDTYEAFKKMWAHAKEDGVDLVIRSATRNFNYQKGIWERKWTGKTKLEGNIDALAIADAKERALAILRFSSMPGTSRHHWGTDIDLNSFENEYFESGYGLQVFEWLQAHAVTYGFCRPYTAFGDHRPAGYQEEKWHWSYTPISKKLIQVAQEIQDEDIKGFKGSENAKTIGVVKKYIFGIDPTCK